MTQTTAQRGGGGRAKSKTARQSWFVSGSYHDLRGADEKLEKRQHVQCLQNT